MSTSLRTPSTSCAYQSGKVSLSPTVTRMPYGSTELSRSLANAEVSRWPARDACDQLVNSGTSATAITGDASFQLRSVGTSTVSRPSFTRSLPSSAATVSHTQTRPSAAHTPQVLKLHRSEERRVG